MKRDSKEQWNLAWLETDSVKLIWRVLSSKGAKVYFVGGCVRDTVQGHEVKDIDIEFKNKNQLMTQSPLLKIKEQAIERDLNISNSLVLMLMQQLEMTQLDLYDEMNELMVINQPEVMPFRTNRRIFLLIGSVIAGLVFSMSYIMTRLLLKYRDK